MTTAAITCPVCEARGVHHTEGQTHEPCNECGYDSSYNGQCGWWGLHYFMKPVLARLTALESRLAQIGREKTTTDAGGPIHVGPGTVAPNVRDASMREYFAQSLKPEAGVFAPGSTRVHQRVESMNEADGCLPNCWCKTASAFKPEAPKAGCGKAFMVTTDAGEWATECNAITLCSACAPKDAPAFESLADFETLDVHDYHCACKKCKPSEPSARERWDALPVKYRNSVDATLVERLNNEEDHPSDDGWAEAHRIARELLASGGEK